MVQKENPRVSVIMPCFNHEKYVAEALESIINQTYNNLEIIVLDNGSTDRSLEIIKQYSDKIDKLLHFDKNNIRKSHSEMLSQCTGQYVAYATSDDVWETEKLEKQMQIMMSKPTVKACFTWVSLIDETSRLIEGSENNFFRKANRSRYEWLHEIITGMNCFAYPSALVERDANHNATEKALPFYQLGDMHLWLELLLENDVYVIEESLVKYRWHMQDSNCNTSTPTDESNARTINENAVIVDKIIAKMESDTFLKTFGKELRHSGISSEEEVLCEKFFLIMRMSEKSFALQDKVIDTYYRNNRYGGKDGYIFSRMLEEYYGYTVNDFQNYCAYHGSGNLNTSVRAIYAKHAEEVNMADRCLYAFQKAMREDLKLEEKKQLYRREVFLNLSLEEKNIIKVESAFFFKIFQYLTNIENEPLASVYNNFVQAGAKLDEGLRLLWDHFLRWDMDLEEDIWMRHNELVQKKDIGVEEFCSSLLPLWKKFYEVLKQYSESD